MCGTSLTLYYILIFLCLGGSIFANLDKVIFPTFLSSLLYVNLYVRLCAYQARKELEAVYLGPRLVASFDPLPGMLSPTDAIYTLAVARLRLWLMYRHPAQGCFRQTDAMPSEQP